MFPERVPVPYEWLLHRAIPPAPELLLRGWAVYNLQSSPGVRGNGGADDTVARILEPNLCVGNRAASGGGYCAPVIAPCSYCAKGPVERVQMRATGRNQRRAILIAWHCASQSQTTGPATSKCAFPR